MLKTTNNFALLVVISPINIGGNERVCNKKELPITNTPTNKLLMSECYIWIILPTFIGICMLYIEYCDRIFMIYW